MFVLRGCGLFALFRMMKGLWLWRGFGKGGGEVLGFGRCFGRYGFGRFGNWLIFDFFV